MADRSKVGRAVHRCAAVSPGVRVASLVGQDHLVDVGVLDLASEGQVVLIVGRVPYAEQAGDLGDIEHGHRNSERQGDGTDPPAVAAGTVPSLRKRRNSDSAAHRATHTGTGPASGPSAWRHAALPERNDLQQWPKAIGALMGVGLQRWTRL